jgi:hypothetical protein
MTMDEQFDKHTRFPTDNRGTKRQKRVRKRQSEWPGVGFRFIAVYLLKCYKVVGTVRVPQAQKRWTFDRQTALGLCLLR